MKCYRIKIAMLTFFIGVTFANEATAPKAEVKTLSTEFYVSEAEDKEAGCLQRFCNDPRCAPDEIEEAKLALK